MATTAAIVVAAARRTVVSHFMARNAVAPADAVVFAPARRLERKQFERLRDSGVIEATSDGRFWLNVAVYDRWRNRLRKRIGLLVGLGAVAAGVAALFAG